MLFKFKLKLGRAGQAKIILAVLLASVFLFTATVQLGNPAVQAADLTSSYQALKNDSLGAQFLNRLLAAGATEPQVEAFMGALEEEVNRRGTLTEANLNQVMYDSLQEVLLSQRAHREVFQALLTGFEEEVDYTLQSGRLHPDLVPLRNAVRDSIFGSPGPGGGGGGATLPATSTPAELISKQLSEGRAQVSLEAAAGQNGISLTAASLRELTASGKNLEIRIAGAQLLLPPGALQIPEQQDLSIQVTTLSSAQAQQPLSNASAAYKIAGKIYEIIFSTETSIKGMTFNPALRITLPYEPGLSSAEQEQLDVFYYNEALGKWQPMQGRVDQNNRTVSFTTSHLSKFAVMAYDPSREKPAPTGLVSNFADLEQHWAKADLERMLGLGLVKGVSATEFAPERLTTRAEMAALLVRATGLAPDTIMRSSFQDVTAGSWYFTPVNTAAQAGLVSGYSLNRFGPEDSVTREQIAAMVMRALVYKGKGSELPAADVEKCLATFPDGQFISGWARSAVAKASQQQLVYGRSGGYFAPSAHATRAEAAVMILRMYDKL